MKLLWSTAICAGLALGIAPVSAQEKTLSNVEVKSDLSAFEDSNALEFWPDLTQDLGKAIATHVNIDDQAEAPRMVVEINKIAINGEPVLPESGEFNQIEGTIALHPANTAGGNTETDANLPPMGSYALTVSAKAAGGEAPEGWVVIPPTEGDFYDVLINAYAMEVVERLEE
ncbi:hypothetical protein BXY70_3549 [Roseovarius halotolerans]|uniref:34 kDa membrane antigen n=1 Tax=Roseovarius halotolerans TaxID=505353 RepID=A0A1X6ZN70_9RHOB|nr:hypothetical protein [Roseovarius halotolerans]RKT28189.1 hypothetical protein BXY70_3549 [Roseovarius halotolerans]SLN55995.1 hypothetical protein ROH8110_03051 [Roseovarius halotolerans]